MNTLAVVFVALAFLISAVALFVSIQIKKAHDSLTSDEEKVYRANRREESRDVDHQIDDIHKEIGVAKTAIVRIESWVEHHTRNSK